VVLPAHWCCLPLWKTHTCTTLARSGCYTTMVAHTRHTAAEAPTAALTWRRPIAWRGSIRPVWVTCIIALIVISWRIAVLVVVLLGTCDVFSSSICFVVCKSLCWCRLLDLYRNL